MRMKSRRTLAILLSMILLLALAPSGFAVDLATSNEVIVNLVPTNQSEMEKDLAEVYVQADLYLLAPAEANATDDSYHYKLPDKGTPFYADMVRLNADLADAEKPEDQNNQDAVFEKFEPYAQAFAGIVLESNPGIGPTASESTQDKQTVISVSGLSAGLYLLIIRGSDLTTKDNNSQTGYVKKTEQASGSEGAEKTTLYTTRVVTKDYEYLYRPQLITVPTKIDNKTPQYNTAYGEWTNKLIIFAKPTRESRNGDLKIIKNIKNAGPDPVTFVFEVSWPANSPNQTTKVVSMTFEKGQDYGEYILADTIPIGMEVEVKEVHSGVAYTAEVDYQSTTIVATPKASGGAELTDAADSAKIAEVVFTNDHSGPGGGYGLLNRFTAGESGDFTWDKFLDSQAASDAAAAGNG